MYLATTLLSTASQISWSGVGFSATLSAAKASVFYCGLRSKHVVEGDRLGF